MASVEMSNGKRAGGKRTIETGQAASRKFTKNHYFGKLLSQVAWPEVRFTIAICKCFSTRRMVWCTSPKMT